MSRFIYPSTRHSNFTTKILSLTSVPCPVIARVIYKSFIHFQKHWLFHLQIGIQILIPAWCWCVGSFKFPTRWLTIILPPLSKTGVENIIFRQKRDEDWYRLRVPATPNVFESERDPVAKKILKRVGSKVGLFSWLAKGTCWWNIWPWCALLSPLETLNPLLNRYRSIYRVNNGQW